MIISRLACRVVSVGAIARPRLISYKFGTPDGPKNPSKDTNSKPTIETDSKSPTQNTFPDNGKNEPFNNKKAEETYDKAEETLKNQKTESSGKEKNFEKQSVGTNGFLEYMTKKDEKFFDTIAKKDEIIVKVLRQNSISMIATLIIGIVSVSYAAYQLHYAEKGEQRAVKKDQQEADNRLKTVKQLNEFYGIKSNQKVPHYVSGNSVELYFKNIFDYLKKQGQLLSKDNYFQIKAKIICGLPGTGKTTTLKALTEEFRKDGKRKVYYINLRPDNSKQKQIYALMSSQQIKQAEKLTVKALMRDAKQLSDMIRWDKKSEESIPILIVDDINMIERVYTGGQQYNIMPYLLEFTALAASGVYVVLVSSSSQFIDDVQLMSAIRKTAQFDVCEYLPKSQRIQIVDKFAKVNNLQIPQNAKEYLAGDLSIRNIVQNLNFINMIQRIQNSRLKENQIEEKIKQYESKQIKEAESYLKRYFQDMSKTVFQSVTYKQSQYQKLQNTFISVLLDVYEKNKQKSNDPKIKKQFGSMLQYFRQQVVERMKKISPDDMTDYHRMRSMIKYLSRANVLTYSQPSSRREAQALRNIMNDNIKRQSQPENKKQNQNQKQKQK